MGIFSKPSPIQKFNAAYLQLKAKIWKMMVEGEPLLVKTVPTLSGVDMGKYCAHCVDYLLGERADEPLPKGSAKKLRAIPVLDAFFAAVLDYKDQRLNELLVMDGTIPKKRSVSGSSSLTPPQR